VPKSVIPALLALPEEQVSTEEYQNDLIQSEYTLADPCVTRHRIHNELLKKKLPRFYSAWIPTIIEEIEAGYREFWGLDTDRWSEVDLHEATLNIVTRMSSRLLVGPAICMFDFKIRNRDLFKLITLDR
jgi:ent-kaurene oxidase